MCFFDTEILYRASTTDDFFNSKSDLWRPPVPNTKLFFFCTLSPIWDVNHFSFYVEVPSPVRWWGNLHCLLSFPDAIPIFFSLSPLVYRTLEIGNGSHLPIFPLLQFILGSPMYNDTLSSTKENPRFLPWFRLLGLHWQSELRQQDSISIFPKAMVNRPFRPYTFSVLF